MDEEINSLENKIDELNSSLLTSSMNIKDDITKLRKEYYKSLLLALRIIQKQKEEMISLKLIIIEKDDEINRKDIMRFCI